MLNLRQRLVRLAQDLWWTWNQDVSLVFRAIDRELWRDLNHNPVAFLRSVDERKLVTAEQDPLVLLHVAAAEARHESYLAEERHWAAWNVPALAAFPVAYLSPEFGIHESLPLYSGGLGVLAGDHLKSCSDLGIRTYGITLLYRQGYFQQRLDAEGRQQEHYVDLDTANLAIERLLDPSGSPVTVDVPIGDQTLASEVWRAQVGRSELWMLDPGEGIARLHQPLRLYGGDRTTRIIHELVLGVGGIRALRRRGVRPGVIHLNEGHSAFAILEAIAGRMDETGYGFAEVADEVAESVVFTTHTPVAAGHDRFEPGLALHYLRPLRERLHLSEAQFLALGRINPDDSSEPLCMTVLALKLSRRANAVSSRHGTISRRMWQVLWPGRRSADVPIGHITNGVHVDTWAALEMTELYRDALGSDWRTHLCDPVRWHRIGALDHRRLWNTKLALKRSLLSFVDRRLSERAQRIGLDEPRPQLRLEALTIGFARRIAEYKRSLLLFRDLPRLKRLLCDPQRPVQILLAGKAHPADLMAKEVIRELIRLSRDPELRDHVVFLEDLDKSVDQRLLEGCDLWLNTPRRPMEACGTSGMKAVFNGTLNCSTLDGWWDEAYDTLNGFAFGNGLEHRDATRQDEEDAGSLMDVLENQVVSLYYRRDSDDLPREWLERIKQALRTLAWRYNSDRMAMDYARQMYRLASRTGTSETH